MEIMAASDAGLLWFLSKPVRETACTGSATRTRIALFCGARGSAVCHTVEIKMLTFSYLAWRDWEVRWSTTRHLETPTV